MSRRRAAATLARAAAARRGSQGLKVSTAGGRAFGSLAAAGER